MPGAPSVNTAANFPRRGEDRQDRGHGGVRVRSSDDQRSLKYPPLPIMGTMEILCTSLVSINFPLSSVGKMQFVLSFVWGLNHNPGCGVTGASCEPPWMTSHPRHSADISPGTRGYFWSSGNGGWSVAAAYLGSDGRPVTGRGTFTTSRAFLGHRSRSQSLPCQN